MTRNTAMWLHGLFAALIGGGAGAVSAGVANNLVDPKDFNILQGGLLHLLQIMGVAFVVGGLLSAVAYLKQSPLPAESMEMVESTVKTSTVTVTPSDGGK